MCDYHMLATQLGMHKNTYIHETIKINDNNNNTQSNSITVPVINTHYTLITLTLLIFVGKLKIIRSVISQHWPVMLRWAQLDVKDIKINLTF